MKHFVYRFDDKHGACLYVGMTESLFKRFRRHMSDKIWWDDVRSISWTEVGCREEAERVEHEWTNTLKPVYSAQINTRLQDSVEYWKSRAERAEASFEAYHEAVKTSFQVDQLYSDLGRTMTERILPLVTP